MSVPSFSSEELCGDVAIEQNLLGMLFGILTLGLYAAWDDGAFQLCNAMQQCDFLFIGPGGARANFAYALGLLRKLLVSVGGVLPEQACNYTLHSLKTTGLSWALQLDVDHTQRRLWGHHRGRDSGTKMASKYSRDDVLPALRAQLHVLHHVRQGWVPLTPQARGSSPPASETVPAQPLPLLSWIPSGLQVPAYQVMYHDSMMTMVQKPKMIRSQVLLRLCQATLTL